MKNKIELITNRIFKAAVASGRPPESVQLVAVSKTVDIENIRLAVSSGLDTFGENYIQEARQKIEALREYNIHWHFIGHLQSNKSKFAVQFFDLIHTVDSLKLAVSLNHQAKKINKIQKILIQVNVSMESTKSGITADETIPLVREIASLENISVRGLMTMPPYFDNPEKARPFFRSLFDLKNQINRTAIPNIHMDELSMGMTDDFEVAISEGATLVRIGTAIFGERYQ